MYRYIVLQILEVLAQILHHIQFLLYSKDITKHLSTIDSLLSIF